MKKSLNTIILFILLISPTFVNAQLNHFIYLQTEGKQPFYAKLDKKILSSSVSGYLIIPKLKDGTYNITIGFPKNENAEQTFVCNVDNKDAGYLIKNFGDKGWGLFNLQTLDVVMAGMPAKATEAAKAEKKDEFSTMLSDVVNDPSIKQEEKPKPEVKPVAEKKEEVKQEVKEEVAKVIEEPVITTRPAIVEEQKSKPAILKMQTVKGESGIEIIYVDINGDQKDTIKMLIPSENELAKTPQEEKPQIIEKPLDQPLVVPEKTDTLVVQKAPDPVIVVEPVIKQEPRPATEEQTIVKKEPVAEEKKFLPIEMTSADKPAASTEMPGVTPMVNSDCKNYATDDDFLKLRKKMAAADNDDDMLTAAHKSFKSMCYTTEQVKNLSVLFLKDAGKYRFFDVAYQYVSDSHNFGALESQLTETYYISRFKVMIRH
jgi:hypothetical protein